MEYYKSTRTNRNLKKKSFNFIVDSASKNEKLFIPNKTMNKINSINPITNSIEFKELFRYHVYSNDQINIIHNKMKQQYKTNARKKRKFIKQKRINEKIDLSITL